MVRHAALLGVLAVVLPVGGQNASRLPVAGRTKGAKAGKSATLQPLSDRERVLQMLDRFTFGPRPGEVDAVMAMGADRWLERQLKPDAIPNGVLDKRLADYPTLAMNPAQALATFPDRNTIHQVADGKAPMPADPLLASVYEVQVYKWKQEQDVKKADVGATAKAAPSDAEKDALKKREQEAAVRLANYLLTLSKGQRMAELQKLTVEDRITLTTYAAGDQRNRLLGDFAPREREAFQAMSAQVGSTANIGNELAQARVVRDVLTERQLQEVMTDFWFNHFNVFIDKDSDQFYTTSYERDVIRKNALGKFRDLLLATAMSPAMMVYLDNFLSIGPNSIANGVDAKNPKAKKGSRGLNENYGREVMELHTVGVNGGYTQADVTALSAVLTGWTVDRPGQGGPFQFDQRRHEPGDKEWFGHTIKEGRNPDGSPNGLVEGLEALTILANNPQTAHFISYLLAQRFVADKPPAAVVDRLAKVYLANDGDIREVLRALVAAPEFNSRQYFRNKVKTPVEFVASAFRSTGTDPQNPGALVNSIRDMGMPLYRALPPTGYYMTADQWMNSVALVDRLNFAYQLVNNKLGNQKFDAPRLLAMGLLLPASPTKLRVATVSMESSVGADVVLGVLEATMVGGEVSPQTNALIHKQLEEQPVSANVTDRLNLLTALVMGSPEFQLR